MASKTTINITSDRHISSKINPILINTLNYMNQVWVIYL